MKTRETLYPALILHISIIVLIAVAWASRSLALTVGIEGPYPRAIAWGLMPTSKQSAFVASLMKEMHRADTDGNGLDKADIEYANAHAYAGRRAMRLSELMRFDLNADNRITAEEISTTYHRSKDWKPDEIDRHVAATMTLDSNHDGAVDVEEIMSSVERTGCVAPKILVSEQILALDPDKDGRLTEAELKDVATAIFTHVDTDRDGTISKAEFEAQRPLFDLNNPDYIGPCT